MNNWSVTKNPNMGDKPFTVCRKVHPEQPMHGGNIEFFDENLWFANRADALAKADELNGSLVSK